MSEPVHTDRIADALVLCMTRGMSLSEWERLGLLGREWALYERLGAWYGRIVVVSYGRQDEEDRAASGLVPRPVVVGDADAPDITARVAHAIEGSATAVVKTNQMDGVGVAVRVAQGLRSRGVSVGLVGRGGYLRSRFAADQFGPASAEARAAAEEERDLCAASDVVVGTTPDMTHALSWRYGVPFERTRIVPNYVTASGPTRCAAERDRVVLYAGQLVARKRVDLLLRACARLGDEARRGLTISIIGEGPERARLESLASELGVPAVFEARLPHAEVQARMSRAAVYAQASALEGHPKTVIEAMALGAAVVVADAPGLGEVVTHGVTGLRVDAQPGPIADAIELLLLDEPWREQMGHGAAQVAQERFGLGVIVPLECAAHRAAMESAGRLVCPGAGDVRWDPRLLEHGGGEAWSRSMASFASRLEPAEAARWLSEIERTARALATGLGAGGAGRRASA